MPRYQYDVSVSRQKKFIRRFKQLLLLVALVVIGAVIVISLDGFNQNIKSDTMIGKPIVTTVKPSIREFDTPYFTFSSPTTWKNIPEETTTQKFVYQGGYGKMLQQQLDIYVNTPPKDLSGTYALPVRVDTLSNRLIPTEVSPHCNTASSIKKASAPMEVVINEVKMLCQLDVVNYIVIVGEKGGSTGIKLKRNDGTYATYYFVYRSSSIPPDTQPLIAIISSITGR